MARGLGKWKVIDDRSGFVISSDKVRVDHKGRITSSDNYDPIHYSELPIKYPVDRPVPFIRPESPNRYVVTNVTLPATYNEYWAPQIQDSHIPEMPYEPMNDSYPYTLGVVWSLTNPPTWSTWDISMYTPNINYANYIPPVTFGGPQISGPQLLEEDLEVSG